MSDDTNNIVHWSFWLISVVALLWNIGGSINYLMQTNLEFVSTLPGTHQAIIIGRPWWATGGFAVGVVGGAIGCILLLLRKSSAHYVFIASLTGILVTTAHTVNVASSQIEFSVMEIVVMVISPLVVAIFLLWYTKFSSNRHWLK